MDCSPKDNGKVEPFGKPPPILHLQGAGIDLDQVKRFHLLRNIGWVLVAIGTWVLLDPGIKPKNEIAASLSATVHWPLFHLDTVTVTLAVIVRTALYLVVLGIIVGFWRRELADRILDRTNLDTGQRYAVSRITTYFIFLVGIVFGMKSRGLDLSSFAFFGGALGIGLGFGMQGVFNNFISGLILLMEHPIRVGDRVDVGGLSGDVVKIGGRATWVRTNDNVVLIVPNSEFTTNRIINWTVNDPDTQIHLPVGVAYGSDAEEVREILVEIALANPDVLDDPPPSVRLLEFGSDSINFDLLVWTRTRTRMPKLLKSDLYFSILKAFREHGIEIPYPQRDLHIRSVSDPIPVRLTETETPRTGS